MLRLVMYGMPAAQAFHQGIHLDISRLRFPAPEPPPENFFLAAEFRRNHHTSPGATPAYSRIHHTSPGVPPGDLQDKVKKPAGSYLL